MKWGRETIEFNGYLNHFQKGEAGVGEDKAFPLPYGPFWQLQHSA